MGRVSVSYTTKFRRKHVLEKKVEYGEITSDEMEELLVLMKYFDKFLHRVGARDNYKPF